MCIRDSQYTSYSFEMQRLSEKHMVPERLSERLSGKQRVLGTSFRKTDGPRTSCVVSAWDTLGRLSEKDKVSKHSCGTSCKKTNVPGHIFQKSTRSQTCMPGRPSGKYGGLGSTRSLILTLILNFTLTLTLTLTRRSMN